MTANNPAISPGSATPAPHPRGDPAGTDPEKAAAMASDRDQDQDRDMEQGHARPSKRAVAHRLLTYGRVEERGAVPVPLEERTSTRYFNVFTIWFSMNVNILAITFGMLGPSYGLGLRDSALVILFFTMATTLFPAYLSTLGPKTGMRQMVQARFSFGRYMVSLPILLNLATMTGFCVIICVVGGQCLSAVTSGSLSPNLGIVLTALLSLGISFCGFKVLHFYETYAWIPALIAIVIAVGCGGSHLKDQAPPVETPPPAPAVVSFAMIVASYMIPWACLASDFTTYFNPDPSGGGGSSLRIFAYTYLGLCVPTTLLMTLGAAIAGAVPSVPEWDEGYAETMVGGVLAAMLAPAGNFGKFVVVVLAFTLLGNISGTMYSITLNFQILVPQLVKVPRYVFSVVITAVVIPVAICAAVDFFANLENFVALIGYWSAAFVSIVITEHVVFRRRRGRGGGGRGGDCDEYSHETWNRASKLPLGAAALVSAVLSFGLIIPCMDQVWYQGPIAETTGDIGFEVALVLCSVLYVPLRFLERKFTGR
ncbi:Purine-cytosine permease fcyB [Zalerion maritima]|uniref:Purine-cytosine permease fcyB n=1 Tax=Zalerion maritima TaxID=339359 RepID=A0AAD5RKG1_9PEZI|nr:Purine-cytosine permease fcyB [Zalerion maritima]